MPAPVITALPTAPQRTDTSSVFSTRADAWVAALANFTTEVNAVASYLDALANGAFKTYVRVATTANHGLSGLSAIDGVTPVAGDRVLVKSNTAAAQNGIYTAASGAWSRATDADIGGELVSAMIVVSEGTTNADTLWQCTTNAPITLGSTSLSFAQFTGGGMAGANNLSEITNASTARGNIGAAASGAVTASGLTMATAKLLGRSTALTGAIEEISVGSGLSLSGGSLVATAGAGAALVGTGQTATGVWDQAVDGTKATVEFKDLPATSAVMVFAQAVTQSVSGVMVLQVSTDNGATWYTASGDYVIISEAGGTTNTTGIAFQDTNATAARYGGGIIYAPGINGTPKWATKANYQDQAAGLAIMFVASASPINAVRVTTTGGGTLNGGKIFCQKLA